MNIAAIPLFFFGLFSSEGFETAELSLSGRLYQVEIADEPHEQIRGLMGHDHLEDNHGMLFLYDEDRVVQFWMKNVLIPLDLIFLDNCGTVIQLHENAQPDDPSIIESMSPVRAVLELRGGAAKRDQIQVGQRAHTSLETLTC